MSGGAESSIVNASARTTKPRPEAPRRGLEGRVREIGKAVTLASIPAAPRSLLDRLHVDDDVDLGPKANLRGRRAHREIGGAQLSFRGESRFRQLRIPRRGRFVEARHVERDLFA